MSPPDLKFIPFSGCHRLSQFISSPATCCPVLLRVELSSCASLQFVLIQSLTVRFIDLSCCLNLVKVLLQCKNLETLKLDSCFSLHTLGIRSDTLSELDLSACGKICSMDLRCRNLCVDNVLMNGSSHPSQRDTKQKNMVAGMKLKDLMQLKL